MLDSSEDEAEGVSAGARGGTAGPSGRDGAAAGSAHGTHRMNTRHHHEFVMSTTQQYDVSGPFRVPLGTHRYSLNARENSCISWV